jgi:hypothetical protein
MAQPNKGIRRQVITRLPIEIANEVAELAAESGLAVSEMTADLVALALGRAKPSETLPRPKSRTRQREELSLGLSA